jgi:hypothetical protein
MPIMTRSSLRKGSCQVGFAISASISRERSRTALPIVPFKQSRRRHLIELTKLNAELDARMAVLDAHPKTTAEQQKKMQYAQVQTKSQSQMPRSGRLPRPIMKPGCKRRMTVMSDENSLDQATVKGQRAQELLDNELLTEAFGMLETNYVSAWRATTIEDAPGREKLFLAINIVGKVRDHLMSVVANGKLAQAELKELAQVAERRKRFGIV